MLPSSVMSAWNSDSQRISEEVLHYTSRQLLKNNGYDVIRDLPHDFDRVSFLSTFGSFLPTPTGTLIGDLKAEPDMEGVYHAQNTRSLVPHTEGYEYIPEPPRYMALWWRDFSRLLRKVKSEIDSSKAVPMVSCTDLSVIPKEGETCLDVSDLYADYIISNYWK